MSRDAAIPSFTSRCPVVREETLQATRLIDVTGGLDVYAPVHFEHAIKWLRSSETTMVVRNADDEQIHDGSTHNDHYGFLTSATDFLEHFAGQCVRSFGATPDGHVEVQVLVTVTDNPVVDAPEEGLIVGRGFRYYRDIPKDWIRRDDALMARYQSLLPNERRGFAFDRVRPVTIANRHVLWSSRSLDDGAARIGRVQALATLALAGLPPDALAAALKAVTHLENLARGAADAA